MKHLYRGVILILILAVGWFAGLYSGKQLAHNQVRLYLNNYTSQNSKLSRVLTMIEKDYVDSISRDSLAELAIPAILSLQSSSRRQTNRYKASSTVLAWYSTWQPTR